MCHLRHNYMKYGAVSEAKERVDVKIMHYICVQIKLRQK